MLKVDNMASVREHQTTVNAPIRPSDPGEWTIGDWVVSATEIAAGDAFELHRHNEDQLAWMASGSLELAVGGDRWHLRRDHAAWIPAGALHEMRFSEPGELISAYVDRRGRPAGDGWDRARVLALDPLGGALLRHLTGPVVGDARRRDCYALLRDLVADAPVSHEVVALPRDPRARAIALEILADPADGRSLAEWAAESTVSAKTIARAFVADTGRTFREWRVRARLHAAVGRLIQGEPVQVVAPAVGYDSVSSFIVAFRSRFGVTPAAYAARSRNARE